MRYRVCVLYTVLFQGVPSHTAIHDISASQPGSTDGVGGAAGAPVAEKPAAPSEHFPETDRFMMQNSILLPGHPAPNYGKLILSSLWLRMHMLKIYSFSRHLMEFQPLPVAILSKTISTTFWCAFLTLGTGTVIDQTVR